MAVDGAEPGDVLKVEIVDLRPRANPDGKTYGSNANAWWGFQARVPKADGSNYDAGAFTSTPGSNDEVITIYELASDDAGTYATPSYAFKWPTLDELVAFCGIVIEGGKDRHRARTDAWLTARCLGYLIWYYRQAGEVDGGRVSVGD